MHYYQFNIAEYRNDTGHLTTLEHGIYRQLIDLLYTSEECIPNETQWVIRRLRLASEDEVNALHSVLADFFLLTKDGYTQKRVQVEVAKYHSNAAKNQKNGKLGGRPSTGKNKEITQSVNLGIPEETQTKGNLRTKELNNLITNTNTNTNTPAKTTAPPNGVCPNLWLEYLSIRKRKKGGAVTDRVLTGLLREAQKANLTLEAALTICVERGWQSFDASWVADSSKEKLTQHQRELQAFHKTFGVGQTPALKTVQFETLETFEEPLQLGEYDAND
jgi:uncharacterized protein YdaU (DUF1376 family)